MVIPGLNSPGLVPAKKVASSSRKEANSFKNEAWSSIRDSSAFWSPKGVRDYVTIPLHFPLLGMLISYNLRCS